MKKIKSIRLIGVIIITAISITALCLHFIPFTKVTSSTEIYNLCLSSIVEIKAESSSVGESFGTGEILTGDGKIITNAHVVTYTRLSTVNEFDSYYIRFAFEEEYRAVKLIKYDTELDLAVLSLEDLQNVSFNKIKMANSDEIKAGDNIYAVGNASNYGIGIFKGIVSVPHVNIELDGLIRSVIQCDLTVAAGNSGGALLNDKGELIGITTFRTKDNSSNVIYGIVYCIPINTVLEYTNE